LGALVLARARAVDVVVLATQVDNGSVSLRYGREDRDGFAKSGVGFGSTLRRQSGCCDRLPVLTGTLTQLKSPVGH
jgi:hypothetical protein